MSKTRFLWFGFLILVLFAVSIGCNAAVPAPTAMPTSTPVPPKPTATATAIPTSTPVPTATPDMAATQEIESRQAKLQTYVDKGYLATSAGQFEEIDDFHQEWPQLNWYQWWPLHETPTTYGNLVFHGHFAWETAARTSDLSGCGIIFGIQSNQDHYGVFVDKVRIAFLMSRGGEVYQVGKTSGSGRLSLQEPAEADVDVIVRDATAYVLVNGVPTKYTLSADQSSKGEFGLSLLSGTNRDFGTRCDITDAYIWTPQE